MLRISAVELPDAIAKALPQVEAVLKGELALDRFASIWVGAAMIALLNADDLTLQRCFATAFRLHVEEKNVESPAVRKIVERAAAEFQPMPLVRKKPMENRRRPR